ncbi:MAG: DUF1993 family protein [Hyphomicrobiales bacterium]
MTDDDLFQATVPVFKHYIQRIKAIVSQLDDKQIPLLTSALSPDTFCAGQHLKIAQGYALRTIFPLLDQAIPELDQDGHKAQCLLERCNTAQRLLDPITKANFVGANSRTIKHTAGMAELAQTATGFVTLYAVPNFYFHLTMGYATLRQAGIPLGKGDFDGHHSYPQGFSFS